MQNQIRGYVRAKSCEVCRKAFHPGRGDARYCSAKCRKRAWRHREAIKRGPYKAHCAYCFRAFEARTSKARYCSRACQQRAYRNRKASGYQLGF